MSIFTSTVSFVRGHMRKLLPACVVTLVALVSVLLVAEERPDQGVFWKIRQEGDEQLADPADAARADGCATVRGSPARPISRRRASGRSSR